AAQTEEEIKNQEANDIDKRPRKEHQLNAQQTQVTTENHVNQKNVTQGYNKEYASHMTNIQVDESVGQTNDKQDKTLPDPAQHYTNISKLNARQLLREAKLQKKELTAHKTPTSELEFSPDNLYTKKTLDTKEEDISKIKESDTPMPDALSTELSLRHEGPSVIDDKEQETPFIVVSHKKPKNKNKEKSTKGDENPLHPEQNQKALGDTC
ncbi:25261_t:CDS:2, partial [Dentiscutata erythropus]